MMNASKLEEVTSNVVLLGGCGKGEFATGEDFPSSHAKAQIRYHPTITKDLGITVVHMRPVEVVDATPPHTTYAGFQRAVLSARAYGLIYERIANDDTHFLAQYKALWTQWHPALLKWLDDAKAGMEITKNTVQPFIFIVELSYGPGDQPSESVQALRERRQLIEIDIMSRFESSDFLYFRIASKEDREQAWTRIAQQIQAQRLARHSGLS